MSAFEPSSRKKYTSFEEAQNDLEEAQNDPANYRKTVQQISEKMLLVVAICSIMISSMHTLRAADITSELVRRKLLDQLLENLPVAVATNRMTDYINLNETMYYVDGKLYTLFQLIQGFLSNQLPLVISLPIGMVVKAVYVFLRLIKGTRATIMYADQALTILTQPSPLFSNANEVLTSFYKDVGGQLSLPNLVLFYILFTLVTNPIVQRVITTSSRLTINMADFLLARIANAMFSNLFSEASMRTIEGTGMQGSNSDLDDNIDNNIDNISMLQTLVRSSSFSSTSSSDSSISGVSASEGVKKIITNFFERYNEVNSGSQEVHEEVKKIQQTVVKSTAQIFFSSVEKFINPGLSQYSSSQESSQESIERQNSIDSIDSKDGIEKVRDVSDLLNPEKTDIIEQDLSKDYKPVNRPLAVELPRADEFPGFDELQRIAPINLNPYDEGLIFHQVLHTDEGLGQHTYEGLGQHTYEHTDKRIKFSEMGFGGKKTTKRRKHKKNKTKDIKKRYTAAKKRKNRNKRYSKKK